MKVSAHIRNKAAKCTIINIENAKVIINDEVYLVIAADVQGSNDKIYRVLVYRSKESGRDWSSCNCMGCQFTHMCSHIYAVEDRPHNTKSVIYDND